MDREGRGSRPKIAFMLVSRQYGQCGPCGMALSLEIPMVGGVSLDGSVHRRHVVDGPPAACQWRSAGRGEARLT